MLQHTSKPMSFFHSQVSCLSFFERMKVDFAFFGSINLDALVAQQRQRLRKQSSIFAGNVYFPDAGFSLRYPVKSDRVRLQRLPITRLVVKKTATEHIFPVRCFRFLRSLDFEELKVSINRKAEILYEESFVVFLATLLPRLSSITLRNVRTTDLSQFSSPQKIDLFSLCSRLLCQFRIGFPDSITNEL
jgi:hypothetical protein